MASSFSWVDFTEEDKNRMADVIRLFSEQDTRDELGFGSVRDALADILFPGTSTIQTRVKYYLFVPWIYCKREREGIPSSTIAKTVREDESKLIGSLKRSSDTTGLIGKDRGTSLQRFPSSVYWGGLQAWGIRLFHGSQSQYHRYLDSFYSARKNLVFSDDREFVDVPRQNWDPGLPAPPRGFPSSADFALEYEQAEYLRDKITLNCRESLLAHLVNHTTVTDCTFPWMHHEYADFPAALKRQLEHAQCFSELSYGANILYNYLLASKSNDADRKEKYLDLLKRWTQSIDLRRAHYQHWDIQDFWSMVLQTNPRIPSPTRRFINDWIGLVLENTELTSLAFNRRAKQMLTRREHQLKGPRARLTNSRALELWSGESALGQLSYRWPQVKTIVNDILAGLNSEDTTNA